LTDRVGQALAKDDVSAGPHQRRATATARVRSPGRKLGSTASRLGRRLTGAALLLLLLATGAEAEDLVADYTAFWAGLPAARIRLELAVENRTYRDRIEIRTEGLVQLLTRFRADAEASGLFGRNRSAEPVRYDAQYDLRKWRDSRIGMRFVKHDGYVVAERSAGDTSRKALLDEKYRRDILDPLTALEQVRTAITGRGATAENPFAIPVYDGTRRFDVVGQVLPKTAPKAGEVQVLLTLRPIAGFKGMKHNDGDPDNAPRPVTATFTDDARRLPILVSLRVFFLPLEIRLDRVCDDAKTCGVR
jgi:hypothetical protein